MKPWSDLSGIGQCRIQYDTGEIEELDLTEVIHDEQMYLLE